MLLSIYRINQQSMLSWGYMACIPYPRGACMKWMAQRIQEPGDTRNNHHIWSECLALQQPATVLRWRDRDAYLGPAGIRRGSEIMVPGSGSETLLCRDTPVYAYVQPANPHEGQGGIQHIEEMPACSHRIIIHIFVHGTAPRHRIARQVLSCLA